MRMVRVEVTLPPEGVTLVGAKEHDAAEGAPLQAKVTAELKPLDGLTVRV
ncbi:MAG: hypothetical protein ACLGSD_11025 [Acidobacteriota bacterium]